MNSKRLVDCYTAVLKEKKEIHLTAIIQCCQKHEMNKTALSYGTSKTSPIKTKGE